MIIQKALEIDGKICRRTNLYIVRKGMQIYLEGKLRTRSWQDKDGNNRYTTEVVAESMVMMSRGGDGNANSAMNDSSSSSEMHDNSMDDLPF